MIIVSAAIGLGEIGAVGAVASVILALAGRYAVFWPKFVAEFDENHQTIRVKLKNRGRRPGQIDDVAVVDREGIQRPSDFAGLPEASFHPAPLKGGAKKRLVVRARKSDGPFPSDARIYVSWEGRWGWGMRSRDDYLAPHPPGEGTGSFFPGTSDWPSKS